MMLFPLFFLLASCKNPGVPRHGVRPSDNFQHGQTVNFGCKSGHTLIGSKSIRCQNGVWSSSLPQCKGKRLFFLRDFDTQISHGICMLISFFLQRHAIIQVHRKTAKEKGVISVTEGM